MATTTPIDVEKYLLEGVELTPTKPTSRLPAKPPLDEALTNYYNRTAEPGSRTLAPGDIPLATSTEVEGPPAPGIMSRLSLPSFGVAPAADRSIAGAVSPLATTPTAPITRGPVVAPTEPTFPTEPLAAGKVPGAAAATPVPTGEKPSGWYDTLQRHAGFVRDVAEAGGSLLAGAGAFTFGAATAVSDILNAQLSRVARGGPMAGGPESSTHYRDIFARMDKTISDLTPEPRSDIARNVQKGVGTITGLVKDVAELPGKGLVATGIMNEDTARVLSFATELYLFYRLDRGVRDAAPELRSKISDFKTRMSKATSDADVASAAEGLADAAAKNSKVNDAMNEARGKFRDEADTAGATKPSGPEPEGPAPGGESINFEFDNAQLNKYMDDLNKATADFRAARPEGFTMDELRQHLDQNVPKPQGRPRQEPAAEAARPAEPTPAPEAARPAEPVVQPEPAPVAEVPRAEPVVSTPEPAAPAVPSGAPLTADNIRAEIERIIEPYGATYEEVGATIYRRLATGEINASTAADILGRRLRMPLEQGGRVADLFLNFIEQERAARMVPPSERRAAPPVEAAATVAPETFTEKRTRFRNEIDTRLPNAAEYTKTELSTNLSRADSYGIIERVRELKAEGLSIRETYDILRTEGRTATLRPEEMAGMIDAARTYSDLPEAAATVAPETVPAPVVEAPAVAATPTIRLYRTDIPPERRPASTDPSQSHVASRHLNYIRDWRNANAPGADIYYVDVPYDPSNPMTPEPPESITPQQRTQLKLLPEEAAAPSPARALLEEGKLAELKQLAMEESGRSTADGLKKLGFTPEEINTLKPQLNKIRAKKPTAAKPAVQTAATEAALDTAPVGTEVEIPAPAEPVVDTSPTIEKPRRARRVVKAPSAAETEYIRVGEEIEAETRGLREQKINQRAHIADQLRSANQDVPTVLAEVQRAYDNGVRPNDMRATLRERGIPDLVAREVTDTAYDLYVSREPLITPPRTPTPAGDARYYTPANLDDLGATARVGKMEGEPLPSAEPTRSPVQLRFPASQLQTQGFGNAIQGAKPDAVFVDTSGINTRTSLADIEKQLASGRMSADVGAMMKANLQRQAELAFLPITEAHTYTGQELMREATRIAAETGIDLYVKKGKNYELVPKDVVRLDARINRGDDLAATTINSKDAGAYVESKTSDIGPAQIREILEAIEKGEDITERLPAELVPHYKQMRETERAGIDTSERRAFIDMLTDFNTMFGESGAIGGSFTRAQRMAAQRLQADMRKAGKAVREFLFGARPEDVAMFESYLDTINNPAPLDSTNPRNMRFDPENIIPGDRIVKQRSVSQSQGLDAVPLWQSEVRGIQNARDIKAGGTTWDMLSPLRQQKAAGTEFIYYAVRTSQKNLNAEIATLQNDMTELGRGFSSRSLENIGANGYARQGVDGQRILTYNKVTPQPLTSAERRLQSTIDGLYRVTEVRLNEARVATGREPLDHIDDYQTFARTFSLLGQLGIKIDLTRATNAEINAAYIKHRATNFPYLVRKHAAYSAEMNALKILDTYMQSALKDIHMSPVIAKIHELIETNLPHPVTGKETWQLKEEKPGLYTELRRWNDFLATGTNASIPEKPRLILNTLNKNIAYATLSGLIRSAGIQLSTLVNTQQAFGPVNTFNGIVANFTDHLTGGHRREFALAHSEILSSRKFVEAYNELTAAIIGRRPRDFFHAIRTGDFGSIQAAVGRPGFKLMEIFDMEAAVTTWNIGYKLATKQLGYNHKEAKRFADDGVVRTQGSTMPGDLTGIQRNALGKVFTQFQTFLISDFNFLRNEVLSKQRTGGGGGGQIPPGGVASGTGDWSKGGKPSTFKLIGNIIQLLAATQLVNELYKMMHIQPAQPDPVEDFRRGRAAGHGPAGLAWDLAVGQIERVPIVGGALRYGSGITGPATEAVRDLTRAARNDPMTRNPYEDALRDAGIPEPEITSKVADPATRLLGIPYTRQVSKTLLGLKRGASVYDSLMGWQGTETGGRERREQREQRPRSERRR